MKKFAILMTAVIVSAMMATAAMAAEQITLRFAGQQPTEHLCTKMMRDFAKEIEQKTKGRVKITVFPANQLGSYELVMEELIRGTVDMSVTSFASGFDPVSTLSTRTASSAAMPKPRRSSLPAPGSQQTRRTRQTPRRQRPRLLCRRHDRHRLHEAA
ncbi:MAG: hypothetical protein ACLUEQ_00700 [Cloacibacillus evryensis]